MIRNSIKGEIVGNAIKACFSKYATFTGSSSDNKYGAAVN
jgi:hypothetical protein